MAQFDSSIIFRQNPYTGPTIEDVQNKQNLNALRNTLGEGYKIDDPKVVNAMMARDPDMGLKLMTNANAMRKSASDVETADQTRMAAELDRYVPVAMAVAQNKDQAAWSELHGELTRMFPVLGKSLPTDVNLAGPAVQSYVAARQEMASKANTAPFRYGAPVATDQGFMVLGENGQPTLLKDASGRPFMPPPKGADGGSEETFGMSPEGGYDAEGNYVPLFRSNRGRITAPGLPPGITYAPPVKAVDTGTGTAFAGPGGRVMGAVVPKDLQSEALQKQVGKDRGEQLMAAPQAVASGSRFLAQLDDLAADPNLERGTGLSSYFNFVPGTAGKAFQVKLNKATGSGFLEAINYLRGTGAISNTEGTAATSAISGLDAGLDAEAFRREIKMLRALVAKGLETARANAAERDRILGGGAGSAAPAPAPAPAPDAGGAVNPADPLGLLGGK